MPDLKVGLLAKFCSFPLEAAHMFPEAGRTAPPGRTERGGGRKMSVSICPWIWGADRPLHLPLEKQGSLEQILSKMAATAQPRLAKDGIGFNKTACGPKSTYGLNGFAPFDGIILSSLSWIHFCYCIRMYHFRYKYLMQKNS